MLDEVRVILPPRMEGHHVGKIAGPFTNLTAGIVPEKVIIDFQHLEFIMPAGITFLANFTAWLHSRNCKVFYDNISIYNDAVVFLDDSGFFERFLGAKLRPHARPRSTTQPLMSVHYERTHEWRHASLVPWLTQRLNITRQSVDIFSACVGEIFNNIKDHSTKETGVVFAQHFPMKEVVHIAVADFGVGIPFTVRQREPSLCDDSAIVRATEEGFTSSHAEGNKGAGLDYLLRTAVMNNGGTVTIYSLQGHVLFRRDGHSVVHQFFPYDNGFCPGTTFDILLRTDAIEHIEDTSEDLEW